MSRRAQIVLLGALGGALGAAGWLPLGLSPFFPLLLVPVFLALYKVESSRDALWLGLAFGIARYAVAAHFLLALLRFSPLAIVFYGIAILYIVPFALLESCGAYWLERRARVPRWLGFAALFAIGEYLRTLGDLSFPADVVAHGMGTSPAWLGLTRWIGPYSVSFVILVAAAGLAWALLDARRAPRRAGAIAAAAVALWLVPAATGVALVHRAPHDTDDALRIGLVQHSATVHEKRDERRHEAIWQRLERLTRRAADKVDLVIWPETARPGYVFWKDGAPLADPRVEALSKEIGAPILYGAEIARNDGQRVTGMYNGALLVHPDGTPPQWYGKQRLLPFAEGVPFASLFGWDPSKRAGQDQGYLTMLGNFSPGLESTIFRVGDARIGVLICYEGFYTKLARRYRLDGANMLVTLTNDAWWGQSVFPAWHARMASSRAREFDVPVVRAATNGVSSVTDRFGRLQHASDLDDVTMLLVEAAPAPTGPTLYARVGDVFVALLAGGLLGAFAFAKLRGVRVAARAAPQASASPDVRSTRRRSTM